MSVFVVLAVSFGGGVLLGPFLIDLLVSFQPPEKDSFRDSEDVAILQVVFRHQGFFVIRDALQTTHTYPVQVEDLQNLVHQSHPVVMRQVCE